MKRRLLIYSDPLAGLVTAGQSVQVANNLATPPVKNPGTDEYSKARACYFAFTQAGAGDANSTVDLVKLPAGKFRILKAASHLVCSAFGAARVLDIGHTGYTKADNTVVAAAQDCLLDGADVSAAALKQLGLGANALGTDPTFYIESKTGTTIQAKVLGDTIPDGAKLSGYIMVVAE